MIRDHYRRPRNRGPLEAPAASGRAHNRFCGDTVLIWARIENGRLSDVTFDGRGCAVSQAAASMLTTVARGLNADDVGRLRRAFLEGLGSPGSPALPKELGDMRALSGVARFPSRVRCAVLPFDALEDALRRGSAEMQHPGVLPASNS